MSFYYLQEEMGLALNDILDRVCSKNRENLKNTSIIEFNEKSLKINSLDIINLANSEGLYSHANSVKIRLED